MEGDHHPQGCSSQKIVATDLRSKPSCFILFISNRPSFGASFVDIVSCGDQIQAVKLAMTRKSLIENLKINWSAGLRDRKV